MPNRSVSLGLGLTLAIVAVVVWSVVWFRGSGAEPRTVSAPSPDDSVRPPAGLLVAAPGDAPVAAAPANDPTIEPAAEHRAELEAPDPADEPDDARAAATGPRLMGSLAFPPGFGSDQFRVTYRRPTHALALPIHLNTRGVFRLFTAAPGPVGVFVHLLGDPSPLRVVPDVEVPSEGTNCDPRLQGIAFPELRIVPLAVVDEEGARLDAPVAVLVLPPRGDTGRRYFFGSKSDVRVPARERPQRLQVWSQGRAAVEVEVHDEATVRLPAAATVLLEVEVDEAVRADGVLVVGLAQIDVDSARRLLPVSVEPNPGSAAAKVIDGTVGDVAIGHDQVLSHPFESKTRGEIRCSLPGRYRVVWRKRGIQRESVRGEGQTIEVVMGQRYEVKVTITAEDLDAARRAAKAK